jgi:hypothetical protein
MEEFYVFVSSEDSLEHFGDNSGGPFRVQFSRTYPMKDKWECALLNVSFVPAFETLTRRAYVCEDFVGNYSYVRNSYQPVLQSVGILHEEVADATFERPIYHETKPFQFYQLEITLKDDRLRVCGISANVSRCLADAVYIIHSRRHFISKDSDDVVCL